MTATIIISVLTCAAMIGCILFKPNISFKNVTIGTYWIVTLVGAIVLISCGLIGFNDIWTSLTANTAINPIKILVLFISMTILSVFLDEIGFFKYVANLALKKAGNKQVGLFIILYIVVSVLTIFTSNDIIILTFTPFICMFCKNAKIDPIPYLISEFVAANTWSMFLIVGNPTNIYLATSFNIDFLTYTQHMALPTLIAGLTSFIILFAIFYKKLKTPIENPIIEEVKIEDKFLLCVGLGLLVACVVCLAISSYIGFEMWAITLGFVIALFVIVIAYKMIKKQKLTELKACVRRAPWELIPFVLSMFVIVLALNKQGVTNKLYELLSNGPANYIFGFSSALMANILNNIPMSVLYSSILIASTNTQAIFGAIIGSNIGAFITPVGALAGIMWSNILRKHDVKFSFMKFVEYGIIIGIPALFMACLMLF